MRTIVDKPSPITGGSLELCKEMAEVTFRGEVITYERTFYRCVDSGLEFADEEMENEDLKQVYDIYRRNHSIPLADELRAMRERYGIPSSAMSLILGLGENQFGLYEEGTVPTVSVGRLLTMAMDPDNMMQMLLSSSNVFQEKQFKKYYDAIETSMHPSRYEVESVGVMDYDTIAIPCLMPATKRISKKPYLKKESYNEYAYANAC